MMQIAQSPDGTSYGTSNSRYSLLEPCVKVKEIKRLRSRANCLNGCGSEYHPVYPHEARLREHRGGVVDPFAELLHFLTGSSACEPKSARHVGKLQSRPWLPISYEFCTGISTKFKRKCKFCDPLWKTSAVTLGLTLAYYRYRFMLTKGILPSVPSEPTLSVMTQSGRGTRRKLLSPSQSTSDSRDLDLNSQDSNPFSTIESAQDFVNLLAKAIREAKQEIESLMEREPAAETSRRLDALRICLYSVNKLEIHMHHSGRILNDLRTLRRLLLAERETKGEDTSAEGINTQPSFDELPL